MTKTHNKITKTLTKIKMENTKKKLINNILHNSISIKLK